MDQEIEVFKGPLLLPPTGKLLMKKSWQQKYCYLFKASKFGIQRLEIWEGSDKSRPPIRIITLENCIKITPEQDTRFTITTKENPCPYEFCALNLEEKNKWLSAFQSVAFPDDASAITSIEEDNDLYCSSGEGIFNVRIHPSPASERCGLDHTAQYTLVLNSTAMDLKSAYDGAVLYTWPYFFIRRYGYKSGKFTFEAGRKCNSGEGTFYVEHSNQQEIFRCISSKMKSMKKFLSKDDSAASLPILDCGDNQFHAALSMEAGSRSPLPPSPTAATTLRDVEQSSSSAAATPSTSSSTGATPKPSKPPRKSLMKQPPPPPNYEPVDKYDKIEYRNDAWRTLGVGEVKHTENYVGGGGGGGGVEEEEYMSWGDLKPANPVGGGVKGPTIIREGAAADDDYDKLEFFGSSSKLSASAGYKQVSVLSGSAANQPPSFNDYDEVQPAMQAIRLADDKHLGYALVRKSPKDPKKQKGEQRDDVDHQFHNNEPYAVISKPKRV